MRRLRLVGNFVTALALLCINSCALTPVSQATRSVTTLRAPLGVIIPSPQITTQAQTDTDKALRAGDTDLSDTSKMGSLLSTPLPTRARWDYGEIVPYTVQSGDTLRSVSSHFNLHSDELLDANPGLDAYHTTLPPGHNLVIPARFIPHLGTPFKIIPDSELVYGPAQAGLDLQSIIDNHGGWLAIRFGADKSPQYQRWDPQQPSWEIIHQVALDYSVNPRLLLALLEFRSGILSMPEPDESVARNPLMLQNTSYNGIRNQLRWAAEMLSFGYYGWRSGSLTEIDLADGRVSRIDPWQNAGTVALHYLFGELFESEGFRHATNQEGFSATYHVLFGDPFSLEMILMPANLQQPRFELPFQESITWSFTGGPHAAWGNAIPWSAIDFAPPTTSGECGQSNKWATAVADGVIARSKEAAVVLDLDGDGNEHTGWTVFYYHLRSDSIPPTGNVLETGDRVGYPSCEGGRTTGTHVHIARKYNGEWIEADGPVPFTLGGWVAHTDGVPYKGRLTRALPAKEIVACECVSQRNMISK